MIINTEESSIEVVGDIKEFKTGIDPKNLEFITSLLSSNLYSDPERSFIREIVSNAWDSQVEAGTTDIPVLVKIDDVKGNITIRDFGTGLSPERFEEVYCNIGSSTKRETNDYIGGFGIGKYSSLAVSNTVYITSYYMGKAYHYVMVKSGNTITTNLVMTLDTEEKNGVEVTVKGLSRIGAFYDALSYIVFFPNVYVDGANLKASILNRTKIKRYKNFASVDRHIMHKLLLGNVLYPLDSYQLKMSRENTDFLRRIEKSGVVLKFDIGELEVTPNRESIIYSNRVKEIIIRRLEEAKAEMISILNGALSKDYDNLQEWLLVTSNRVKYDFVSKTIQPESNGGLEFNPSEINFSSVTYKGINISDRLRLIKLISNTKVPGGKAVLKYGKIREVHKRRDYISYVTCFSGHHLMIPKGTRLTSTIKSYLRDHYDNYYICEKYTFEEFVTYIQDMYDKASIDINSEDIEDMRALRICYDFIMDSAVYIDFETENKFIKYKAELKANRALLPAIKDIRLYVYSKHFVSTDPRKNTYMFTNLEEAVKYIQEQHKGIILGNIGDNNMAEIACARGFLFITAAIPVIKALRELKLSNIVDPSILITDTRVFSKLATFIKYAKTTGLSATCLDSIPEIDRVEIKKLFKFYSNYTYDPLISHIRTLNLPEDSYIKSVCAKINYYLEGFQKAEILYPGFPNYSDFAYEIRLALIMKSKTYRISKEAYNRIKNNKIITMLCQR